MAELQKSQANWVVSSVQKGSALAMLMHGVQFICRLRGSIFVLQVETSAILSVLTVYLLLYTVIKKMLCSRPQETCGEEICKINQGKGDGIACLRVAGRHKMRCVLYRMQSRAGGIATACERKTAGQSIRVRRNPKTPKRCKAGKTSEQKHRLVCEVHANLRGSISTNSLDMPNTANN